MTNLIKLSDNLYVAKDAISTIRVIDYSDMIYITMKDGTKYDMPAEYGKGIYETVTKLVSEVNTNL